ncbi:hypothetical protein CFOL_v3_09144 [Cephalotus follicularis]|uniref:Uncharacterized protein n=1 Tax=Cephalotus follicularis TaxID=3775 RepID=A0A1Q3BCI2_CEPFO|nr:hypothetical protein CFOL_v3_09144 [Cephalotus follicularis]
MPLPWKKTRISRLVADLQSPKRGGSLVVETGFPTSLIDLFVKNRDRLKKKKKSKPQGGCSDLSSPSIAQKCNGNLIEYNDVLKRVKEEEKGEVVVVGGIVDVKKEKDKVFVASCAVSVIGSKSKCVFVAVLMMFVVAVLALSNKKFAVVITLSAFALLLLEYAAKYFCSFLFEPCLKPQIVLDSLIKNLPHFRGNEEIVRYQDCRKQEIVGVELVNSSTDEIERVESNSDLGGFVEPCLGGFDVEKRVSFVKENEDRNRSEVLMHKRNEGSKRAKIKSILVKKLVPKKLRSSKNGSKNKERERFSGCEITDCIGEDKLGRIEDLTNGGDQEQVDLERSSQSPLEETEEESCRGLDVVKMGLVEKNVGRETKGNSGYLVLVLIVLAGLVGGRIPAFAFTVVCCLMIGFVGRLRRSMNVKMIRSHVPISC